MLGREGEGGAGNAGQGERAGAGKWCGTGAELSGERRNRGRWRAGACGGRREVAGRECGGRSGGRAWSSGDGGEAWSGRRAGSPGSGRGRQGVGAVAETVRGAGKPPGSRREGVRGKPGSRRRSRGNVRTIRAGRSREPGGRRRSLSGQAVRGSALFRGSRFRDSGRKETFLREASAGAWRNPLTFLWEVRKYVAF